MSELFDAFLMVDWSAKKTPNKGPDSVWICLLERHGKITLKDPFTRHEAFSAIEFVLQSMIKDKKRCLVGFDFPFGYPAGFAKELRLSGIPWLNTWEYLFNRIQDEPNNANNRFEIAAEINRLISNGPGPFWGCPPGKVCDSLATKRPKISLPQDRITDRKIPGPQSIWKLYGNGSVGSQALMGIPYLYRLRFQSSVSDAVRVWPFETGFGSSSDCLITLAEVYPSLLPDSRSGHAIKDARQVIAFANGFANSICPMSWIGFSHQLCQRLRLMLLRVRKAGSLEFCELNLLNFSLNFPKTEVRSNYLPAIQHLNH